MFIQTEATPNPATLKFIPGRVVVDGGPMEFANRETAARSPLAEKLFDVPGVTGVFYGSDFITVTKANGEWQQLKPAILGAIMEHYMSGAPLLADGAAASDAELDDEDEFFDEADAETVDVIKDLIETRVRPAVANDGGDITFRGFKDGIVYLNMKGSCAGCPSSTATLQHGIQNLLKHFVPDVVEVRPM
jgi:Fe-S cluster biogenesis protein NfuA